MAAMNDYDRGMAAGEAHRHNIEATNVKLLAEIEKLRAGSASARDCLERCFEPTVPLRVIQSEMERAVKDAYIALRRTLSN